MPSADSTRGRRVELEVFVDSIGGKYLKANDKIARTIAATSAQDRRNMYGVIADIFGLPKFPDGVFGHQFFRRNF